MTNIMKNNFENVKYVNLDDNLIEGGLDSITAIKFIIVVEETFEFEFYDEDLHIDIFKTLNAMVDYIDRRLNADTQV